MCRRGTENILVEGFSRRTYQAGSKEEIHGCGEIRHADSWCERICRRQGEMEDDDKLWKLLEIPELSLKRKELKMLRGDTC